MWRWLLALPLVGCQPGPPPEPDGLGCGERPTSVVVRLVLCGDDVPPGGDGVVGDYLIAGPDLRVVVRNEQSALTTIGVAGGTVIDAAAWGERDYVHELIPLVDDGWLRDVDVELLDDGIAVQGVPAPLLELPGGAAGGPRMTITWRLDGDRVTAEGADALLVRADHALQPPAGESELIDAAIAVDGLLDVPSLVVAAGDSVSVTTAQGAISLWNPQGSRVSGVAPGADRLWLTGDTGTLQYEVAVRDGGFDLRVGPDVTRVQAVGPGRAPSPRVPVASGLDLALGATGEVEVLPSFGGREHPVRVAWRELDDPPDHLRHTVLPPRGGVLPTGPGRVFVFVSDADRTSTVHEVMVPDGGSATLEPDLAGLLSPRVDVAWAANGNHADAFVPLTDTRRLESLAAAGVRWAALVGDNRVGTVPDDLPAHLPHAITGARLELRDGGELVVWPLRANVRRGGRGAPNVADLPLADAIAAAGADRRQVLVELEMLDRLGTPGLVTPRPTHVALAAPGSDGPVDGRWAPLWRWYDAGVPIVPVGDRVLVDVPDPLRASATELQAALVRGRVMASSGADVWLTVGDAGPGEILGELGDGVIIPTQPMARPDLPGEWREQVRAGLVVDGQLHRQWRAVDPIGAVALPVDARWVSLVVWVPGGAADAPWAVTMPVWLRPPTGG